MALVQKEAIINFGSDGNPASITIDGRTYTGFAAALGSTSLYSPECASNKTPGSQMFTIEIESKLGTTLPAYTLFHRLKGRVSVSSHT